MRLVNCLAPEPSAEKDLPPCGSAAFSAHHAAPGQPREAPREPQPALSAPAPRTQPQRRQVLARPAPQPRVALQPPAPEGPEPQRAAGRPRPAAGPQEGDPRDAWLLRGS